MYYERSSKTLNFHSNWKCRWSTWVYPILQCTMLITDP